MKRCQSCGRLTELLEDFAGLDQSSQYCSSCADDSGKLRTFEDVLENLTQRIAKTDGFDEQASRNAALQILGRQPAWEPKFCREGKVKTNKRKLVLVGMALVFIFSAGGLTWWLTSRYYKNWGNPYELHIANYDDPFKDVSVTEESGCKITEFLCKGDQKLTSLKNGILQFESCEDAAYIAGNKQFVNIDAVRYSSYLYNINKNQGMDMRGIGIWDNEKKINNLVDLVDSRLSDLKWTTSFNIEDEQGNAKELVGIEQTRIGSGVTYKVKFSVKERSFLRDEDTEGSVICRYGLKTVEVYPSTFNSRYGFDHYLFIVDEQNGMTSVRRKINLGTSYIHLDAINKNIAVLDCQESSDPNKKTFLVVNLENNELFHIQANDCEFKVMVDENRFVYQNNNHKLFLFDISLKTASLIGQIDDKMYVLGATDDENTKVILSIRSKNGYNASFWAINSVTKTPKKICDGVNMSFVGINNSNIVWSSIDRINQSQDKNVTNMNSRYIDGVGRIAMTNIDDGYTKEIIKEINLPTVVMCDGANLAWVIDRGSKGDQWNNVCFTTLH